MKRIIIIMISVVLLVLSFLSINEKIIQPLIANKKYEKELSTYKEEFLNDIIENSNNREEKLKELQDTEYVTISLPETEEEICRTLIGTYFHNINMGKYEVSYNMLDEKFRNNYFQTLEAFKQYCQEKYTDYKILEYVRYERRTDFILVKIIVKSLTNEENQHEEQINIAEKGNNQYTLSFGIEG